MFDIFNISKMVTIVVIVFILAVNVYFYTITKRNYRLQEKLIRQKQQTEQKVQEQKIKDFTEEQKSKKENILKSFKKKDKNVTKKAIISTSDGKHTLVF